MKIVFIAAHPDDIEFGCAGTINKLVKKGYEIEWILMTKGENDINHSGTIRLEEMQQASSILGVKRIRFLDFLDGGVSNDGKTVGKIMTLLSELKPGMVFTHYPNDRHQDHRNTAYSVLSACWGKNDIAYFNSYSSFGFQPNMYVDVTNEIEVKRSVLSCYMSQINKYAERNEDFIGASCAIDKKNGVDIHCAAAEGFQIVNCVWNI